MGLSSGSFGPTGRAAIAIGLVLAVAGPLTLLPDRPVRAELHARPVTIDARADVVRACRQASEPGRRRLYVARVAPRRWRFGSYQARERFLPVEARSGLKILGGAARLLPAGLEPIGFVARSERAGKLRKAGRGAFLRLGFFLGYDNHHRSACLVQTEFGVTTARVDVAFVELVSPDGRVLAREDTERLRAWLDDIERDGVPGSGPRGALGAALRASGSGAAPNSWQRTLQHAHEGPLGPALSACHREGIARGGAKHGRVVVRLEVEASSGRILESRSQLSSLGSREAECVAGALQKHLRLAPLDRPSGPPIALSVPVRLTTDS